MASVNGDKINQILPLFQYVFYKNELKKLNYSSFGWRDMNYNRNLDNFDLSPISIEAGI